MKDKLIEKLKELISVFETDQSNLEFYKPFKIYELNAEIAQLESELTPEPKPQMTAEVFYAERNGGKDDLQSAADNELISPVWACILMKDYAEYVSQFQKPLSSDELRKELIKFLKSFGYDHEATLQKVENYLKQRKP